MATKRAGEAFFKHIAEKRAPSLFKKMMRSLDSGQYHVPKSFDVMSRFPSDELKLNHASPRRVILPENQRLKQLQETYAQVKQEPVPLASFQAPTSRRLIWRQLQAMQLVAAQHPGRASQSKLRKARQLVEQEMGPELTALNGPSNRVAGHVSLLQAEEELQLKAALDEVAAKSKAAGGASAAAR